MPIALLERFESEREKFSRSIEVKEQNFKEKRLRRASYVELLDIAETEE